MGFIVDDLIKCPQCKEIFKSPVFLLCGHSICKHHVDEVLKDINNDIENREIECLICQRFHRISESVVFTPNKTIESLIEKNMDKINLGEEYKSAVDRCNIFGDLLDKFNKIKNDPDMRINTVISELKNKVDLRREELKQEIDKETLKMIDELNEYEKECKLKMKLASNSKLDEKLEGWKNSLKQWQLALSKFDSISHKSVLDESTSKLKDLHSEFLNFDRNLFLNRLNQFKYPNVSASNNLLTLK